MCSRSPRCRARRTDGASHRTYPRSRRGCRAARRRMALLRGDGPIFITRKWTCESRAARPVFALTQRLMGKGFPLRLQNQRRLRELRRGVGRTDRDSLRTRFPRVRASSREVAPRGSWIGRRAARPYAAHPAADRGVSHVALTNRARYLDGTRQPVTSRRPIAPKEAQTDERTWRFEQITERRRDWAGADAAPGGRDC